MNFLIVIVAFLVYLGIEVLNKESREAYKDR